MQKTFNIVGACNPDNNYMVDLSERLKSVTGFVSSGAYFVINRARQFGKTTMLKAIADACYGDYILISTSFQGYDSDVFRDGRSFSGFFAADIIRRIRTQNKLTGSDEAAVSRFEAYVSSTDKLTVSELFLKLTDLCMALSRKSILIIDEVDEAANNQVFTEFLGQMRRLYLERDGQSTFWSVILAGVYDIKNLKQKMRPDSNHKYNSPWNIATDFNVDMSFGKQDIRGMLTAYQADHGTGMNLDEVSSEIYDYSAGYPFLVSDICKIIDEELFIKKGADVSSPWSAAGVREAVHRIVNRPNMLFDDMIKHLDEYPDLARMIQNILFEGISYPYNYYSSEINIGTMFGFLVSRDDTVAVSNRIFETFLYNFFLAESLAKQYNQGAPQPDSSQFIIDGNLNMRMVMEKFAQYYLELDNEKDSEDEKHIRFIEDNGRKIFLMYLKAIINGTGNYYIESRTRNNKRTDVIVDYKGRRFIIELKIWRGDEYNRRGEDQLAEYLDFYHKKEGYLLSYNFNKNKTTGVFDRYVDGKHLVEVVV